MLDLNWLHSAKPTAKESEVNHRPVPYTTSTGIKIGSMYQRKQTIVYSRDMELLQTALLNRPIVAPSLASRIAWRVRFFIARFL